MSKFNKDQREIQTIWREKHIVNRIKGTQNKKNYAHILPKYIWTESLWSDIRTTLPQFIEQKKIQPHSGVNNLLSSWVVTANLYFPLIHDTSLKEIMLEFIKQKISTEIQDITDITLEFAFPVGDRLHPSNLLGEMDGSRGSGQTSPDVAFLVKTKNGEGVILTECKFTESSFYRCSARRKTDNSERKGNPNPLKCMQTAKSCNYKNICHQTVWGRKYWDLLTLTSYGEDILKRCPAATSGYQLFRQQALAEGIMESGNYEFVVSSVAFDERNEKLKKCLSTSGIDDFQTKWASIFEGKASFKTWTHQEWVQYVRENQKTGEHNSWLDYLNDRYDY